MNSYETKLKQLIGGYSGMTKAQLAERLETLESVVLGIDKGCMSITKILVSLILSVKTLEAAVKKLQDNKTRFTNPN